MGYKVDKYLGTIREDDAAIATSAASQAVTAASQAVSAMNKVMEQVNLIHLGPCSALGIVWTENGAKINWTDPEDVSLNDSVLAEWNKTVLIRKIGSYPTSPTDGVLVAQTSRAAANKNYYRDHLVEDSTSAFILTQDETFQSDKTYWHVVNGVMVAGVVNTDYAIGDAIPANTWYDDNENVYYYMLFSETTGEAVTVSDANKYPVYTGMSWAMLKMFVRAGTAQNYTNLGDLFEVDHLEYTLECRLEGYDTSEPQDETLTHSIRLGVENILFQSRFDEPELKWAHTADTAAVAGQTYYYKHEEEYIAMTEGTDYDIGGNITHIDDLATQIPIENWYQQNNSTRVSSGNNRYSLSNIDQWLNSDGAKNEWYVKSHIFDTCVSTLAGKNGFLRNIDPDFKAALLPVKIRTALSNTDGGGSEIIARRCFLRSMTEVYGTAVNNVMEGEQLGYYVGTGNSEKIKLLNGTASTWWLRSPNFSSANSVYYVQASGASINYTALSAFGVSPAFALG